MEKVQTLVSDFIEKYSLETSPEVRFIDLMSELGELGKEILKGNSYGSRKCEQSTDFEEEIGDTIFSLICLANTMEIDLEVALKKVLLKYEKRFAEKEEISSGR